MNHLKTTKKALALLIVAALTMPQAFAETEVISPNLITPKEQATMAAGQAAKKALADKNTPAERAKLKATIAAGQAAKKALLAKKASAYKPSPAETAKLNAAIAAGKAAEASDNLYNNADTNDKSH